MRHHGRLGTADEIAATIAFLLSVGKRRIRLRVVGAAFALQAFMAFLVLGTSGGRRVIQFLDQKIANPNPDFFSYTMAKHAFASTVKMLAMAQPDPATRVYGLAPGAMLPSTVTVPL